MAYDAVKMADWQISEAAEPNMPTPDEWREKLALEKDEILPMGRLAKLDFLKIINRLQDKPDEIHRGDGHHADAAGRRQKHHFMRFDGRPRQTR
jgi:hypothetical protein